MKEVIIYSKKTCPYCDFAKKLLSEKQITYTEILIDEHPEMIEEMLRKSNGLRTVPQIFINCKHVGGYDDLAALNKNGELDKLINS